MLLPLHGELIGPGHVALQNKPVNPKSHKLKL